MLLSTIVKRHSVATDAWTQLIKNIGREEAYLIVRDMLQFLQSEQDEWEWYTNSPKGIG